MNSHKPDEKDFLKYYESQDDLIKAINHHSTDIIKFLTYFPRYIVNVKNPTREMYRQILKVNAEFIYYIPKEFQTEAMCWYAVKKNIYNISQCDVISFRVCLLAFKNSSKKDKIQLIKHIDGIHLSKLIEMNIIEVIHLVDHIGSLDFNFMEERFYSDKKLDDLSSLSIAILMKQLNVLIKENNKPIYKNYMIMLKKSSSYKKDANLILSILKNEDNENE